MVTHLICLMSKMLPQMFICYSIVVITQEMLLLPDMGRLKGEGDVMMKFTLLPHGVIVIERGCRYEKVEEEEIRVEDLPGIALWFPKGLKIIPKWTRFFVNDVRRKQGPEAI